MTRASWVLSATTLAASAVAVWLYVDNRALHRELESAPPKLVAPQASLMETVANGVIKQPRSAAIPSLAPTPAPQLPDQRDETRMERRARGQQEFAAMFGRAPGETPEQWRDRIMPLVKTGLALPRTRVEDMRKTAEEKAHVSADQSRRLDQAFAKVYDDVLAYTDKAVADRLLSPYERNVAGWLDYAGGLGTILGDAQAQIAQVLSADQIKMMSDSGFEWAEYLGLEAPWEKLQAPPVPR
jgi:hypothetical protein